MVRLLAKLFRKSKPLPGRTISLTPAEATARLAALLAAQRTNGQW